MDVNKLKIKGENLRNGSGLHTKKVSFSVCMSILRPMKTYAAFLDMLILYFLALAVHFSVNDNYIVDDVSERRGALHINIISWQTFFVVASFCVFLRYIARKVQ